MSRLLFSYANALVRLGKQKHLQQSDLWGMLPSVRRGGGRQGGDSGGGGGASRSTFSRVTCGACFPQCLGEKGIVGAEGEAGGRVRN